jgi:hypothetical protein
LRANINDNGNKAKQRQQAIEALGAYAREGQLKPDISNLLNLIGEESDRGAVVLVGSAIEDALLKQIVRKLPDVSPSVAKSLVRSGGMLNGFANKITLAHAQGIIDDELVEMLRILKLMRNASAHSRLPIGFATPAMRNVMLLLFDDQTVEDIGESSDPLFLRFAFIVVSGYVFMRISGIAHSAAQEFSQGLLTSANHEAQLELAKIAASQKRRADRSELHGPPDRRD